MKNTNPASLHVPNIPGFYKSPDEVQIGRHANFLMEKIHKTINLS